MTVSWCHDACSSLLGTRERLTCIPAGQEWLKKRVCEREKRASALGWNMDTQTSCILSFLVTGRGHSRPAGKPLSCPQNWTAHIVMSRDSHLAGGLSNKKAKHTTQLETSSLFFSNGKRRTNSINKKILASLTRGVLSCVVLGYIWTKYWT